MKREGESYRFDFFAVGLAGSVPLQQLFDGGFHADALVHPRLICIKTTACQCCLSNSLFTSTIADTLTDPPPSALLTLLPAAFTLIPQYLFTLD